MGKGLEMQKHEFDAYIKDYRKNLDAPLALSGESSAFFAEYKVQKMAEWFCDLLTKKQAILDYGCGDGLMTSYAKKYFPQSMLFGIDPSSKSIEDGKRQYADIEFDVLQNNKMPYKDASMDVIYSAGVFHHIPFDEHQACAQEIFRVLKPGGIFILFELNPFNPLTVLTFKRSPVDQNATMVFPQKARKLLKPFGSLTTKYYCFFPAFLKKLRGFERFMIKIPLGALYAIIVTKSK